MRISDLETCPDCGQSTYWDEEVGRYVHVQSHDAQNCWLARNEKKEKA